MSQSGKSCPWCTCAALLKKKKNIVHFLLQKKDWKKKEEKERLTKPLHCMLYQYAYPYCFPYISYGADKDNLVNSQELILYSSDHNW